MLHCVADGKGGQTIKDTGPLTKKRMETIDEEITVGGARLDGEAGQGGQAVLPLVQLDGHATSGPTSPHKNRGKSGQDDYSDRMVTHDEQIGQMLDKLDELGIADNTIVMYSTDNGPENDTWPGWRQHAVPQPEGHQLGRRLARAVRSSAGPARSRPARS